MGQDQEIQRMTMRMMMTTAGEIMIEGKKVIITEGKMTASAAAGTTGSTNPHHPHRDP